MKGWSYVVPVLLLVFSQLFFGCGEEAPAPQATEKSGTQASGTNSASDSKTVVWNLSMAKDGVYTAESTADKHHGTGRLTVTIQDHRVTQAEFVGIDRHGEIKGESYGKHGNETDDQSYKKAQNALRANAAYAKQLVEEQDPNKVDAITGASVSYQQFTETAKKIAEEMRE